MGLVVNLAMNLPANLPIVNLVMNLDCQDLAKNLGVTITRLRIR